jgi:hypothetical protein
MAGPVGYLSRRPAPGASPVIRTPQRFPVGSDPNLVRVDSYLLLTARRPSAAKPEPAQADPKARVDSISLGSPHCGLSSSADVLGEHERYRLLVPAPPPHAFDAGARSCRRPPGWPLRLWRRRLATAARRRAGARGCHYAERRYRLSGALVDVRQAAPGRKGLRARRPTPPTPTAGGCDQAEDGHNDLLPRPSNDSLLRRTPLRLSGLPAAPHHATPAGALCPLLGRPRFCARYHRLLVKRGRHVRRL